MYNFNLKHKTEVSKMKKVQVSKIQKQFWILNEIYPKSGAYNLFSVFRLSEPLKAEYVQKALQYVVDRHEPLRTSFEFIDSELFQIIQDSGETGISFTEVNLDQQFDEERTSLEIYNEVNRGFDLVPIAGIATSISIRNSLPLTGTGFLLPD